MSFDDNKENFFYNHKRFQFSYKFRCYRYFDNYYLKARFEA